MGAIKAWACLEDSEGTGGVVFARKRQEAEIIASRGFGCGEGIGEYEARRAPWADKWARLGVDIPIRVMVENGWHFECCGCGERIDEDNLHDRDLAIDDVIGTQNASCFCSEACKLSHDKRQAIRKEEMARGLAILRDELARRLPGATLVERSHAYVSFHGDLPYLAQGSVYFDFPGRKIAHGELRFNEPSGKRIGPTRPEVSVCVGDKEAFAAFLGKPVDEIFS